MSISNRKLKSFVDKLLALSKSDGIVQQELVTTVMDTLKKSPPRDLETVLKLYRKAVEKDLRASTAIVSYAGELSADKKATLQTTLETKSGRKLEMQWKEDPELIAGIKVAVGDYVYDHSIKSMLERLSA
jgi:F-type H+-transporting ATPase subunit delta